MKLMITNTRVAFAHGLFKASALEEGQQPKFGADFILADDSVVYEIKADKSRVKTTMKEAMLSVANEAWKGRGAEMLEDLEASKKCWRKGDRRVNKSGDVYEGFEGHTYVTAKSASRPGVYDRNKNPVSADDGVIYSGCYVNVLFDIYANTDPKKKGVFAGLTGVQFVKDGDSFGGGGAAKADDFDDLGAPEGGDLF